MSIDVEALKNSADIVSVIGSYVALKKRGAEFVGLCPFHADKNPSFWVVPAKRMAHCFSCDASHDVISFIEEVEGVDFKEACRRLGANTWEPKAAPAERPAPRPERITSKPPADAPTPAMRTRELGEPSRIWPYRDSDGGILGYVARYETPEGKQIRCWTWGARGSAEPSWGCGHWNAPRPLYGRDQLAARESAPALVVEGEKAADAAQALLPSYVVVTWAGGSKAWHKADWHPLAGRRVLLWPDNDETGIEAMEKLAPILHDPRGIACPEIKIIDPNRMPDSFDAADFEGTGDELIAWAKPRARIYQPNPRPQAVDAPLVDNPPQEPAGAGPSEMPPAEFPAGLSDKAPKKRPRPRLAAVDGNTALAEDPEAEPLPPSMSEDYIADAFAAQHETDWRYVKSWDAWMHWDGDGWRRDRKELVDRLAVEMCRRACTWTEALTLPPASKQRLGQRRTAGAVRDLARHDRRIAATSDGWDADPMLVGIPGGVYDVKAAKVVLGEREQYITRRTEVAPASGKPARWLEHLRRMMDGDEAMIDFLHLYAGYCATGDTREQCFIFLYGMGQTGKGTFLLTLAELLGDYAAMSGASTFMTAQQEKHTSEIARLAGCRLVVVDETDGTARWNEERLKRMTGGGKITAARKYHDEEDIRVTWKLAFAGNHKPALRGVGKEMERRIRLIKCNASIPDEQVDRNFRARMIAEEGPQILQWIFDGAARWLETGLPLPSAISDATRDYLTGEDTIGDWLGECCEDKGECDRPSAFRNYAAWSEKRGDRAWSSRAWWSALEDRGYTARKTGGTWRVKDMTLKMSNAAEEGYHVYPED